MNQIKKSHSVELMFHTMPNFFGIRVVNVFISNFVVWPKTSDGSVFTFGDATINQM